MFKNKGTLMDVLILSPKARRKLIWCCFAICRFVKVGSPYASSPYVPIRYIRNDCIQGWFYCRNILTSEPFICENVDSPTAILPNVISPTTVHLLWLFAYDAWPYDYLTWPNQPTQSMLPLPNPKVRLAMNRQTVIRRTGSRQID